MLVLWLGVHKKVIRGCAGLWKGFTPTDLIGYEDRGNVLCVFAWIGVYKKGY